MLSNVQINVLVGGVVNNHTLISALKVASAPVKETAMLVILVNVPAL